MSIKNRLNAVLYSVATPCCLPVVFLCHFRFPKLDFLKMTTVQSRQLGVTFLAISQVSSIYFQERLDWTLGQYMATFVTIDLTRGQRVSFKIGVFCQSPSHIICVVVVVEVVSNSNQASGGIASANVTQSMSCCPCLNTQGSDYLTAGARLYVVQTPSPQLFIYK